MGMIRLVTVLAFAIGLPVVLTGAAGAQSMKAECYERAFLIKSLTGEYGERLDQARKIGQAGLLEAFKSPTEGTWTIIYSNDKGLSCVLATGEGLDADPSAGPEFTI
jgi:hypothetical protein